MKTNTKRFLIIAVLTLSLAVFAGCTAIVPTATDVPAPAATEAAAATEAPTATDVVTAAAEATLKVFTAEELVRFDGQNGNPAYVAVDGIVYDVSGIPQWSGGSHAGGTLKAGMDQTEAITNLSPHGKSVLEQLPIIGTLE